MSLRLILALALLIGVLSFVGVGELVDTLRQVEPLYIFYLLLISVIIIWASCMKWQLFVQARGHKVHILHLMKLYTMGYFFNTFTPSYVGGDVARSYHLGRFLDSQKDAFIATILERFTGLIAMASLGVLFVVIGTDATADVEVAVLLVGAAVFVLAVCCFYPPVGNRCFALGIGCIRLIGLKKLAAKVEGLIEKLLSAIDYARNDRVLLAKAMFWSYAFHTLTIVNTYVAARAVGWADPDFAGMFVVVPLVLLVSMAPITPSGLGIQEGAFVFFLQRIGGSRGESLGVGLVLRAKVMLVALVGWLLWLTVRDRKPQTSRAPQSA